ncbi:MAG TPA: hypothetical protein VNT76_22365 [Candidatus Binatus sp.]|nr:hypothetical protein [Candidatus Binatus sp.]
MLTGAKNEGKVTVSIPASPELRGAGLPVKALPALKEGTYGTGGGNVAIIKAPAHPNATKLFVNWVLSREEQKIVSKALGQALAGWTSTLRAS